MNDVGLIINFIGFFFAGFIWGLVWKGLLDRKGRSKNEK